MTRPHGRPDSRANLGYDRATGLVSADAVAAMLHSAADLRQARALSDEDVRCAIAVAMALGEIVMSAELQRGAIWSVDIPIDSATSAALSSASGATAHQTARALELLLASQVVLRVPGNSATVRLTRECVADIALSVVDVQWDQVRRALRARSAAVMPALAVFRELLHEAPNADGWVICTLERAASRTFFRRSTVARALGDLEAINAIERARRSGLRSHYYVLPNRVLTDRLQETARAQPDASTDGPERAAAASGVALHGLLHGDLPVTGIPASDPRAPSTSLSGDTRSEPPVEMPRPSAVSMAVIEVAGVRFPIPPGVTVSPEFDDDGFFWYRVGSARIGPIATESAAP